MSNLRVPKFKSFNHSVCLQPECGNGVVVQLGEINASQVTGETCAVVDCKDHLQNASKLVHASENESGDKPRLKYMLSFQVLFS